MALYASCRGRQFSTRRVEIALMPLRRLDYFGCGFLSRSDLEWLDAWEPPEWLYSEPDGEAWAPASGSLSVCVSLSSTSWQGATPPADHGAQLGSVLHVLLVHLCFLCSCAAVQLCSCAQDTNIPWLLGGASWTGTPRAQRQAQALRLQRATFAISLPKDSNSVSWSEFKEL